MVPPLATLPQSSFFFDISFYVHMFALLVSAASNARIKITLQRPFHVGGMWNSKLAPMTLTLLE